MVQQEMHGKRCKTCFQVFFPSFHTNKRTKEVFVHCGFWFQILINAFPNRHIVTPKSKLIYLHFFSRTNKTIRDANRCANSVLSQHKNTTGGPNPEFSDRGIPLGEIYFKFWKPQIRLFLSNFGNFIITFLVLDKMWSTSAGAAERVFKWGS